MLWKRRCGALLVVLLILATGLVLTRSGSDGGGAARTPGARANAAGHHPALHNIPRAATPSSAPAATQSPVTVAASPPAADRHDPATIPPIQQRYRNDCEATALSMLLATAGIRRSQTQLVRLIPRSPPGDPGFGPAGTKIWGDPDQGFVGRIDGGGFAVYQGPVLALVSRLTAAEDLTGASLGRLWQRLRHHRTVMAWVGLDDGPYERWQTPGGKAVVANLNEHSILLVGTRPGALLYNDPLDGTRKSMSRAAFAVMWQRLGRRAVTV